MNWNNVLDRMRDSGLPTVEDVYMENYGKILTAERPEFRGSAFPLRLRRHEMWRTTD